MGNFIFWATYWIARIYFKLFRGLRIYGLENVPKHGPVILAGNHISNMDPPLVGSAVKRKTWYMAKKELFANRWINWYLRNLGAFPVDRGKADLEAIRTSIKVIKDGGALVIFPEGTRHQQGSLGKAQSGVVMIALRTQATIIPCGITNSGEGKRPVVIRFGEPISLAEYYDHKLSKEEMESVGELIMGQIAKLLEMDRNLQK